MGFFALFYCPFDVCVTMRYQIKCMVAVRKSEILKIIAKFVTKKKEIIANSANTDRTNSKKIKKNPAFVIFVCWRSN